MTTKRRKQKNRTEEYTERYVLYSFSCFTLTVRVQTGTRGRDTNYRDKHTSCFNISIESFRIKVSRNKGRYKSVSRGGGVTVVDFLEEEPLIYVVV